MRGEPRLVTASWCAAAWAAIYAVYRGYFAVGGTVGMFGVPRYDADWRYINGAAAVALAAAAALPVVVVRVCHSSRGRVIALALCWVIAVGCTGHALVGAIQRVLSLNGMLVIGYPFWLTIDRREADLQALLWNGPWFLIEGALWHAMAWTSGVRDAPWRAGWIGSLLLAVTIFTIVGVLSAIGVLGRFIAG